MPTRRDALKTIGLSAVFPSVSGSLPAAEILSAFNITRTIDAALLLKKLAGLKILHGRYRDQARLFLKGNPKGKEKILRAMEKQIFIRSEDIANDADFGLVLSFLKPCNDWYYAEEEKIPYAPGCNVAMQNIRQQHIQLKKSGLIRLGFAENQLSEFVTRESEADDRNHNWTKIYMKTTAQTQFESLLHEAVKKIDRQLPNIFGNHKGNQAVLPEIFSALQRKILGFVQSCPRDENGNVSADAKMRIYLPDPFNFYADIDDEQIEQLPFGLKVDTHRTLEWV